MSMCIVCVQICWCSCYERSHELTSLMDPCLEGGGPSFSSRCILPQTMKITMVVPTSRIRKNKMPITRPAIAPPLKPVGRGRVNHVTDMRQGHVMWWSHRHIKECVWSFTMSCDKVIGQMECPSSRFELYNDLWRRTRLSLEQRKAD